MQIRLEQKNDWADVHALNVTAFETSAEADLVDALRVQAKPIVSLVAVQDKHIVGHIMFSPVTLSEHPDLKITGLAPMAVLPGQQRQGIGSALVRAGLEHATQLGFVAAVVLGHPKFYPGFGFFPSTRCGIDCEYEVPPEVFMAMELQPGSLDGKSGKIKYHAAFESL